MSADTDARKLPRTSERRQVFEHLVVVHAVRVDRKRYLPGLDALALTHAHCHAGMARDSHEHAWDAPTYADDHQARELISGTFEAVLDGEDGFAWVRVPDAPGPASTSDALDALVRERDREASR